MKNNLRNIVLLFVLHFFVGQSSFAATYYLTTSGAGAAQTPSNWNTGGSGGGGSAAVNFTTAGDIFIIDNATTATFAGNAIFGSGANPVILQVNGSIVVNSGFTLTIGVSPANSVVVFSNSNSTQCSGAGSFTLAAGSTLKTQNANGVKGANCSIATAMAGTLNTAANYEFNGTSNQVTLGLPFAVNNLNINNGANTVTISANINVSGVLNIAAGSTLNFGVTARTVNLTGTGANTLNSSGTIDMSGGNAAHELWIYANSITNFGTLINGTTANANTVRYLGTNYTINNTPTYNILRIDGGGTATSSGNITIAANGTLWIYGVTFDLGTYTANCLTGGSATFLIQGDLKVGGANNFPANYTTYTFNGNRTITYNMNGNQTIFTKAGFAYDCWLVLSGSGIKQVTGQPLAFTSGLGYSTTVNAGVTLDLNGIDGNTISTLTGSGTIDNLNSSGTGNYTLTIKTPGAHGTFSGLIKNTYGTIAINKQGIYTQTLSGLNTYSGGTTISNGIIALGISSSSAISGPLGAASGGINVLSGASLFMNGFSLTGAAGQSLSLNGSGYGGTGGYGALSNQTGAGTPTYSGLITLTGNTQIFGDINITHPGIINGSGYNLTLRSQGGLGSRIESVIGTGAGTVSLVSDAGQSWTLSGASTYSGATNINAGTLKLGAAGTAANTPLGTTAGVTTVVSGAVLDLNGYSLAAAEPLTLNGTGISNGGALKNSSSAAVTYPGLIKLGSTGASIIANAGDINLTNTGAITGAGFGLIIGGSGNGTISSILSTGAGSLTKTGSGKWTLTGANSYSGTTSVQQGGLVLGAAGVIANNSAITFAGGTFQTGAAIGYTDTVGAMILSANSTLALGTGSHRLVFTSAGTFSFGKTLTITGWQGAYNGTGGTAGKVFVGSTAILTSTQLSQIKFFDGTNNYAAGQLSTGEVVPLGVQGCNNLGMINGGFETPEINLGSNGFFYDTLVPGWTTTASDRMMEIWSNGFGGVPAFEGKQFCEINAYQAGALFQDVATTPGDSLYWKCAHRGRSGVDVMSVNIGPPSAPILQQTCSDGNTAWGTYSGIYVVPAGQTVTRFQFLAVSSAGGPSFGNFIDDVGFKRFVDTTVCSPAVYTLYDGTIISTPGVYADQIYPGGGCPEDVFVRLNFAQGSVTNRSDTICNGQQKFLGGAWRTTPGIYTDTYTRSSGCDSLVNTNLVVKPMDPVTISSEKNIFCANDSARVCAPAGYISYQWNVGGTGSCIEARQAGNYYVSVTDANNCTAESNRLSLNVYPVPSVSIVVQGDTLSSFGAVSYQWIRNGVDIPGANSPLYIANESGQYSLRIVDGNGCESTSTDVDILITGLKTENTDGAEYFKVFSNPTDHGVLQWAVPSNFIGKKISIFNAGGQLVFSNVIVAEKSEANLSYLADGLYFVKLDGMIKKFILRQ